MFVYGGPGSQQVTNSWGWNNYFWYQHLAQQGYIIACATNSIRKTARLQLIRKGFFEYIDFFLAIVNVLSTGFIFFTYRGSEYDKPNPFL